MSVSNSKAAFATDFYRLLRERAVQQWEDAVNVGKMRAGATPLADKSWEQWLERTAQLIGDQEIHKR